MLTNIRQHFSAMLTEFLKDRDATAEVTALQLLKAAIRGDVVLDDGQKRIALQGLDRIVRSQDFWQVLQLATWINSHRQ
jgi:hypothetical protein